MVLSFDRAPSSVPVCLAGVSTQRATSCHLSWHTGVLSKVGLGVVMLGCPGRELVGVSARA